MKKEITKLRGWLLLAVCWFCTSTVMALSAKVNGIYYSFDSSTKEATVEYNTVPTTTHTRNTDYTGNVVIPQVVEYNNVDYTVTTIGMFAFHDCTQMTSITLPESIVTVKSYAFQYCTGLKSFTFPASVREVDGGILEYCSKLTTVVFSENISSIPQSMFYGCSNLTNVSLPEAITSIGNYAFWKCTSLTSINIPANVSSIGSSVFYGCSSLKQIDTFIRSPFAIDKGVFSGVDSSARLYVPLTTKSSYQSLEGWRRVPYIEERLENGETFTAVTADGIKVVYKVTDTAEKTCEVVSPATDTDVNGSMTIPAEVYDIRVTSIGSNAFGKCSGLSSLLLPASINMVKSGAFSECGNLKSVSLLNTTPPDIELLAVPGGKEAFADISPDAILYVPVSTKSVYETSKWKLFKDIVETRFDGEVFTVATVEGVMMTFSVVSREEKTCIAGGKNNIRAVDANTTGSVTIPAEVDGLRVIGIADNAFASCSQISVINIPETVTTIGHYAFREGAGLTSVNLPNTVKSIGDGAFNGCENLESITLPNSITTIEGGTFWGCANLKSVSIPASVKTIGYHAFWGCKSLKHLSIPSSVVEISGGDSGPFYFCESLESIVVEAGNPVYDSRENCNAIIETATNTLVAGCKNTVLPSSVTKLAWGAFFGCAGLTSFTIPNTVLEINSPFGECDNLSTLIVNAPKISDYAFSGLTGLSQLTIGESVEYIGNRTFRGCQSLTSVVIPSNVAHIGNNAFSSTGITTVEFLHTKEQLDALKWDTQNTDDFKGPSGTTFKFSADVAKKVDISYFLNQRQDGFYYWARANKVCFSNIEGSSLYVKVINGGSTSWVPIAGDVSDGKLLVSSPAIDKSTVGAIDLSVANSKSDGSGRSYTITGIGAYAFQNCSGLTSVVIGDGVTTIGREAFADNAGLSSVTIGKGLTTLSRELFRNCSSLTSVTIPDNVTSIEIGVFCDCTGLTSVTIPNSVSSIGTDAFYKCTSLTFIAIPESVTSLEHIFGGDTKLTVVLPSRLTQVKWKALSNVKCAVFTGNTPPGLSSESSASTFVVNQISVPKASMNAYSTLFNGHTYLSAGSMVGYETTPVEVTVDGEAVTSCKLRFTSYILQDGSYRIHEESGMVYGLDPESSKEYSCTLEDGNLVTYKSIVTTSLSLTPQPAQSISNTKAVISAATNGDDDGLRFGFEWRRYDAPDMVPSTVVNCPVYDGVLAGTLNGLSANTYYKYRPFYKSDAGNVYYGDWIAFGTADAYVYFEPLVHTYEAATVTETKAVLRGYAVAGSDDVIEQGFEYWAETSSAASLNRAPQNVQIVKASGTLMTVTLTDLQAGTTYYYRTYVKTATETTYGEEMSFQTAGTPSMGIVQTRTSGDIEPFNVYTLSGKIVRRQVTSLDGLQRGVYIVNRKKVMVR